MEHQNCGMLETPTRILICEIPELRDGSVNAAGLFASELIAASGRLAGASPCGPLQLMRPAMYIPIGGRPIDGDGGSACIRKGTII